MATRNGIRLLDAMLKRWPITNGQTSVVDDDVIQRVNVEDGG
jgi:hypothetical protein